MTVGVYGLVGAIVKLDDFGAWLDRRPGRAAQALGRVILRAAPWLMKGLSVGGTIAMFLVGGNILGHGVPRLHEWVADTAEGAGAAAPLITLLLDVGIGLAAGAVLLAGFALARRLRGKRPAQA
jgi:predicted DNA repair protein MutK